MSWSPRHLLPLHKALADHLVDRRFDEARGDRLAMTVAVPVVHDKAPVVLEVPDELLQSGQQTGLLGTAIRGDTHDRVGVLPARDAAGTDGFAVVSGAVNPLKDGVARLSKALNNKGAARPPRK